MADSTAKKELKIKTGVLKRYLQEVEYYQKEVQKETDKMDALKAAPEPDKYMIMVSSVGEGAKIFYSFNGNSLIFLAFKKKIKRLRFK